MITGRGASASGARVQRAQDYIAAGDIYQVNLSQRLSARVHAGGLDLYRRLRAISPCGILILTGRGVSGEEALRMGLANRTGVMPPACEARGER